MIRICAWCNTKLGEKEPLEDKRPTHTICKECADEIDPKIATDTENNQTESKNENDRTNTINFAI